MKYEPDDTIDLPAQYPLTDWLNDYTWFSQETKKFGPHSASMGSEHFREYFYRTRKNPQDANYCQKRFEVAMAFLTFAVD